MEEKKEHTATGPDADWYDGWDLTPEQRARYAQLSKNSYQAKLKAVTEKKLAIISKSTSRD